MNTEAKIKTYQDKKGNTIVIESLIPVFLKKRNTDKDSWLLYSPHLNTLGYSRTSESEAKKDFQRAISAFFDVHSERGTLEKALFHFGWSKENNVLRKPKKTANDQAGVIDLNTFAMAA